MGGNLRLFTLVAAVFLCNTIHGEAKIVFMTPNERMTPSPILESHFVCSCPGVDRDVMLCANNGITYTSSCKFACDQKENPYLKITKEGTCAGVTLLMHQEASRKRPHYQSGK